MLIDIVAFVLLLLAVFTGFRKGLIVAIFSFLSFFIGLAAALKLSAAAAEYLGRSVSISQRWLPVLAFISVFVVVVLLVRLGAKVLEGVAAAAMMGWVNRLGGIFFYILVYFFIYSVLLFYASQLRLITTRAIHDSVTYDLIAPMAPKLMGIVGAVIPFFKNMFGQLLQFFEGVSGRHPQS